MIADKVTILNKTTLECLDESDEAKIIQRFTETGIQVLDADFGFVWLNSPKSPELKLSYKSENVPFTPNPPRKNGRNRKAMRAGTPDFVAETDKALDSQYVSRHIRSFVIIPLVYKRAAYGSMVLCFKAHEPFPKEKRILCQFIGNSVAQTITISRFIASEHEALEKEERAKRVEQELKEETLKMEFIANATHELRTPLAIIRGNIDLALKDKGKIARSSSGVLRAIEQEVKHLSNILSDLTILTATKEQWKKEHFDERISLKSLLADTVRRSGVLAKKRSISLVIKSVPDIEIIGHRMYLEKLFINLVANSIIYGNDGGKTVIAAKKHKGDVVIDVADNGIGISREDLPHLFERFFQADKSHSTGGTGLGLAIVKWIADIHGGTVSAKSAKGKGSTFRVVIPLSVVN
ncbi:MAG: GAF domain-containing sensor histidine kinase [bacterium]